MGIFADTHDHKDRMRQTVDVFNARRCELVLFAGDFVSPIVLPPLRKLNCPLIACWGDNEGNRRGVEAGVAFVGCIGEPPLCVEADGCRILLTHQRDRLGDCADGADIIIFAHTHKPLIAEDDSHRLWINPGEAAGWVFGRATVAVLDTTTRTAEIIELGSQA